MRKDITLHINHPDRFPPATRVYWRGIYGTLDALPVVIASDKDTARLTIGLPPATPEPPARTTLVNCGKHPSKV